MANREQWLEPQQIGFVGPVKSDTVPFDGAHTDSRCSPGTQPTSAVRVGMPPQDLVPTASPGRLPGL